MDGEGDVDVDGVVEDESLMFDWGRGMMSEEGGSMVPVIEEDK